MRHGRLVVFSIVSLLASVNALAIPTAAQGPQVPVWTIGDFWEYEGAIEILSDTVNVTMRIEVKGVEEITVNATAYSCYRTNMTAQMDSDIVSFNTTSTAWFRKSDLAMVRMEMELLLGSVATTSWDPPVRIDWPLEPGKEWSGTTVMNMVSDFGDMEEEQDYAFEVESKTSLHVAAGTFDVYPIKDTSVGGAGARAYYSSKVGNYVQMEATETIGLGTTMDLVKYKFQKAPETGLLPGVTGISVFGIDILWILLTVILIVVVVALLLVRRRKPPLPAAAPLAGPPPAEQVERPLPPPPPE